MKEAGVCCLVDCEVFNELGSLLKERWEVDSLFTVKARKNTKCVFHIGRNTVLCFLYSELLPLF